ncbi:leptin-like [Protopterus annectens]|uniref:leptin-like n=1 Tax=Protopterus annectens TaxID=7888 RepID=UPI001CF9B07D|nr:leptin-like [Protopterus annectens]
MAQKLQAENLYRAVERKLWIMNCTLLPFCGLLWMSLNLCASRPVADRVKIDAKNLTRTIIARLQQQNNQILLPRNLKISGLEFIPVEIPLESLESMDETLEIFEKVLASLALDNVLQILYDIENLRTLIQSLAASLGCSFSRTPSYDTLQNWTEEYAISPYTTEKVALDRLQKCLHKMAQHLEHVQSC